jgi:hypothetical protein
MYWREILQKCGLGQKHAVRRNSKPCKALTAMTAFSGGRNGVARGVGFKMRVGTRRCRLHGIISRELGPGLADFGSDL